MSHPALVGAEDQPSLDDTPIDWSIKPNALKRCHARTASQNFYINRWPGAAGSGAGSGNNNTLVALALLVAESLPAQKTLMIRLIEHFLLLEESPNDNGAEK